MRTENMTLEMVKYTLVELKNSLSSATWKANTIKPTDKFSTKMYWQAVNDVRSLQDQIKAFTSVWGS